MADYIYLLEHRLAATQRASLQLLREIAGEQGLTLFLVGGAVRDLTSGAPVRDLDVVVQGNAPRLRKAIERAGAVISGELDAAQALFLRFPGGVRVEIGSTLSVTYPKPGKPVYRPGSLQDDLRRRDFTANSMALSLNEGSYGLLVDPLNGVADIENRQLRLVSNYGFIEDPARMIRAARLMARLGWTMEERTAARYETGREEGYISVLSDFQRGYELEEIVHEEDPLRVLKRLEAEGWMKHLAPFWGPAAVNGVELDKLREAQMQLQVQGIVADGGSASFPLLTSKLPAKEVAQLKGSFPRQGFVAEIDRLEADAKEFAAQLGGKPGASPSGAWKLIHAAAPEAVLQTAFANRGSALQAKFRSFFNEWPQARQRLPYALMAEMRITPEVPGYDALLESLFLELMDGHLGTQEEMTAFLQPFSPPAPPPPVNVKRPRMPKKDTKPTKSRAKKGKTAGEGEESSAEGVSNPLTPPNDQDPESNEPSTAPEPQADAGSKLPAAVAEQGSGKSTDATSQGSAKANRSKGKLAEPIAEPEPVKPAAPGKGTSRPPAKTSSPERPAAPTKASRGAAKEAEPQPPVPPIAPKIKASAGVRSASTTGSRAAGGPAAKAAPAPGKQGPPAKAPIKAGTRLAAKASSAGKGASQGRTTVASMPAGKVKNPVKAAAKAVLKKAAKAAAPARPGRGSSR